MTILVTCLFFLSSLTFLSVAYSDEIVIQDVNGTVRAQAAVEPEESQTITMSVTNEDGSPVADGTTITLTPTSGGEPITAVVEGGVATFTSIAAGSYTVASSNVLVFAAIEFGSASLVGSSALGAPLLTTGTGATIAGVAAAGGAVAISSSALGSDGENPFFPPVSPFK